MDVDKQSPDYLAGRRDLANELVEQAQANRLTLEDIKAGKVSTEELIRRKAEVDALLTGGES